MVSMLKSSCVQADITQDEVAELVDISIVLQRSFLAWMTGQLGPGRVSLTQFMLLSILAKQGNSTMSQLAVQMRHTTAATTGLVDRLVEGGMVARTEDLEDRRKVMVKITLQGQDVVERIRMKMCNNLKNVCDALGSEDSRAWMRIYRRLHEVSSTLAPS
jgi:DNA-binding MarR family transcriptional regulator